MIYIKLITIILCIIVLLERFPKLFVGRFLTGVIGAVAINDTKEQPDYSCLYAPKQYFVDKLGINMDEYINDNTPSLTELLTELPSEQEVYPLTILDTLILKDNGLISDTARFLKRCLKSELIDPTKEAPYLVELYNPNRTYYTKLPEPLFDLNTKFSFTHSPCPKINRDKRISNFCKNKPGDPRKYVVYVSQYGFMNEFTSMQTTITSKSDIYQCRSPLECMLRSSGLPYSDSLYTKLDTLAWTIVRIGQSASDKYDRTTRHSAIANKSPGKTFKVYPCNAMSIEINGQHMEKLAPGDFERQVWSTIEESCGDYAFRTCKKGYMLNTNNKPDGDDNSKEYFALSLGSIPILNSIIETKRTEYQLTPDMEKLVETTRRLVEDLRAKDELLCEKNNLIEQLYKQLLCDKDNLIKQLQARTS